MRATISAYLPIISLFVLAVIFSSCDSSVTDSPIHQASVGFANVEAVADTFRVLDDIYSAAGGSVTVTYLGEQVSTNYTSTWTPLSVAATLALNINNDDDIQLYATVVDYSKAEVRVRERRTGSQYIGNPVYLSDSNSTNHIKLSDSVIYLAEPEE